jgi:hypothetical protein
MNMRQISKMAAIAAAVAASGSASAQLYDQGSFGQATYSSVSSGYAPGRSMKWNNTGTAFNVYCIDPYTGTSLPGSYSTMSLASFTDGTGTSGYAQQIGRGGSYTGLSVTGASQTLVRNDLTELFSWAYTDATSGNTAKAAAFGLAVWEIILQNGGTTGTTYSRSTGSLTSNGGDTINNNAGTGVGQDAVEYWLNAYLAALNGNTWTTLLGGSATATNWNYTVYFDNVSPVSQSFIRVTAPGTVPEPTSVALVALGLLGAAGVARRNKKA